MPLRKNASDVVLCHRPINAKELASIVDDIFALDRNKAIAGRHKTALNGTMTANHCTVRRQFVTSAASYALVPRCVPFLP